MIVKGMTFDQLPADITVDGIVVETRVSKDETNGSGNLTFVYDLSPDNGATWHGNKSVALTTTPTTHFLGSPSDKWGKSSWSRSELQSGNFAIRVEPSGTGITGSPEYRLHFVGAVVHFTNSTTIDIKVYDEITVTDAAPHKTSDIFYTASEGVTVSDGGVITLEEPQTVSVTLENINDPLWDAIPLFELQEIIDSTSAGHAFSVQLQVGEKTFLLTESSYETSLDQYGHYQAGLIEVDEISMQGAAGTDSRPMTATVALTADVVQELATSAIDTLAGQSAAKNIVGAPIKIRLHVLKTWPKPADQPIQDWRQWTLFVGVVDDVEFREERVELSCRSLNLFDVPFPTLKFDKADVHPDVGGQVVKDAEGAVIPIALGRFDLSALGQTFATSHPMGNVFANRSDVQAVLPSMLGIVHPQVPLLAVWQQANPFSGTPAFGLEGNLLLQGDSRSVYFGWGEPRIETTPSTQFNSIWPGYAQLNGSPSSSFTNNASRWRWQYTAISTWNESQGRKSASPFLIDISTDWSGQNGKYAQFDIRKNMNGVFEASNVRNLRNGDSLVWSFPYFATTTLGADNAQPHQTTLGQATAIPMKSLSENRNTRTYFDVTPGSGGNPFGSNNFYDFKTTENVTSPEACLDTTDMSSFTTVPDTGSVSLKFPLRSQSRGKMIGAKLCWLTDGSQPSKANVVYVAVRQFPGMLVPLARPGDNTIASPWRFDSPARTGGRFYANSYSAFRYDSTQHTYGSIWLSAREFTNGIAQVQQSSGEPTSHGFENAGSWEFTYQGYYTEHVDGVNVDWTLRGPILSFAGDIVFWVGKPSWNPLAAFETAPIPTPNSGALHLIAVWLEIVYESPSAVSADEWDPPAVAETTLYRPPRSRKEPPPLYRWTETLRWRSNLDPRKPIDTTSALSNLYLSGRGPYGDPFGQLAGPLPAEIGIPYPHYTGAISGAAALDNQIVERGADQIAWMLAYLSPKQHWINRAQDINWAGPPPHVAEFGSFEAARFYATKWLLDEDKHKLSVVFNEEGTFGDAANRIARQSFGFVQQQIQDSGGSQQMRLFVETPETPSTILQTERLYRGTGYNFSWDDLWPESLRVSTTNLDNVANDLTLRYGYHAATNDFTATEFVNPTGTSLPGIQGQIYRSYCLDSVEEYGLRKDIIEAPDVWDPLVAHGLLRWHTLSKVHRRVVVQFETFLNGVDLQPGHYIKLSDDIAERVKYPGRFAGANWSDHIFTVTSVVISKDEGSVARVHVTALELFSTLA